MTSIVRESIPYSQMVEFDRACLLYSIYCSFRFCVAYTKCVATLRHDRIYLLVHESRARNIHMYALRTYFLWYRSENVRMRLRNKWSSWTVGEKQLSTISGRHKWGLEKTLTPVQLTPDWPSLNSLEKLKQHNQKYVEAETSSWQILAYLKFQRWQKLSLTEVLLSDYFHSNINSLCQMNK